MDAAAVSIYAAESALSNAGHTGVARVATRHAKAYATMQAARLASGLQRGSGWWGGAVRHPSRGYRGRSARCRRRQRRAYTDDAANDLQFQQALVIEQGGPVYGEPDGLAEIQRLLGGEADFAAAHLEGLALAEEPGLCALHVAVSNLLFDGKTHLHRVYEQDVETDVTKIGLRDAFELAAGGEDVEPARLSYETAH